jgi:hypothetical protein
VTVPENEYIILPCCLKKKTFSFFKERMGVEQIRFTKNKKNTFFYLPATVEQNKKADNYS